MIQSLAVLLSLSATLADFKVNVVGRGSPAARPSLVRGTEVLLGGSPETSGTVKLYRDQARSAPTARVSGHVPAGTFSASLKSAGVLRFQLPLTFQAGRYLLRLETGKGMSDLLPVTVVNPKMAVTWMTEAIGVNGTVEIGMNHAAPTVRVVVKRVNDLKPPVEWWAPFRTVSRSEAALPVEIVKKQDGTVVVKARVAGDLGGGFFDVHVHDPASGQATPKKRLYVYYMPIPIETFSLRFDSIACEVDTDEMGDDEVYPIFVSWRVSSRYDLQAKQWYANTPAILAWLGDNFLGMNKGKSRSVNSMLLQTSGENPLVDLGLGVILMERDDDENGDRKYYQTAIGRELPNSGALQNLASLITGAFKNAQNKNDDLDDDLIGIRSITFAQAKQDALRQMGWHKASLTIPGDGGRYVLRFSVRCDPLKGRPLKSVSPTQAPAWPGG